MIIWGWRVRFAVLARGTFFCPACGGDRTYASKQGRRWFTLFFIPIIPLDRIGDPFVECDTCHQGFRASALERPTSSALSQDLLAATREAVVWLLRGAVHPGPATVAAAVELLSLSSGMAWSEQALRADVAGLDVGGLANRLGALAGALNEHGKETFLGGCARVAVADGSLTDEARRLLDHIGVSLGMSPAHVYGVVSRVSQAAGL